MNVSKINLHSYCSKAQGTDKNQKEDLSFGKKYYLDKYKAPRFQKIMNHEDFVDEKVINNKSHIMAGSWTQFNGKNSKFIPWKMHIYSDNTKDWQKMISTIEPYLADNDISWKTLSYFSYAEDFDNEHHRGKIITIYPHSKDEFLKLAHDLNYIIKKNKLQLENTSVHGDRELGNSGRIFYRYELSSGKYKDTVFDKYDKKSMGEYNSAYLSGERTNNYLAKDMTLDDDPFHFYNPDTNCFENAAYTMWLHQQGKK